MKRIVVWASIQYAVHVDGATIHVTGPDERQVEFGDGTMSFATLSGSSTALSMFMPLTLRLQMESALMHLAGVLKMQSRRPRIQVLLRLY